MMFILPLLQGSGRLQKCISHLEPKMTLVFDSNMSCFGEIDLQKKMQFIMHTPLKFNITPEKKRWLEDDFPFGMAKIMGLC